MNFSLIDLESTDSVKPDEEIPPIACVYFLYDEDQVVYVGQTKNLSKRIPNHIEKGRIHFDYIKWFYIEGDEDRMLAEYYHIKTLQPKYNRTNINEKMAEFYKKKILERGELVEKPKKNSLSITRRAEPTFILFNPDNQLTRQIQHATSKVLYSLFQYVTKDNEIFVPSGIKNRIGNIIGMELNLIDQNLSKLCRVEILNRLDAGIYYLNPDVARHPEYYK